MKPLFARVLLERPKEEKTKGGILLPEESQKRLAKLRCKVLAVGRTCEDDIKSLVGKEVLIGRHAGDWINVDGLPGVPPSETKEYFIVQEEDILAEL